MRISVSRVLATELLGFIVRRSREEMDMSRGDLAKSCDVSRDLVKAIEHAREYRIRRELIVQMINVLRLDGEKRSVLYELIPLVVVQSERRKLARYPNHRLVLCRR